MNYKVIDKSRQPPSSLFRSVFIRNLENRSSISRFKWFKLNVLEIIFGVELIESVVNSSTGITSRNENLQYGKDMKLNNFIPSGLLTNFFRASLIEVLYFKYYQQYYLLRPTQLIEKSDFNENLDTLDCSYIRFSAFKEVFYQLISLRRVYESCHLIVNISIDVIVYSYTNRVELALLSALIIESIRRLVKV
ncbi:hypothetical protein [Vibrio sp. 10N.222.54.F10]|uniref:hypothetical protein n=1 Tax=Vibrio sp. 10N.222.54.F10 TaxID=1884469 RepID=UPI000CB3C080|nr:hypothetical protein [Vibrio sp. 10N.222.54.F10]PMO20004.1 hypothetical protein BCT17_21535 [Vibrio sp. 10N.222.54.F10]